MSNLERIHCPRDLKGLSQRELADLAGEIRERIIQQVSRSGGHLASNLGVVELTLVLHQVFDAPDDLILWDVGHQTYTHKLITGRQEQFSSLRADDGLSGFTVREESPYDVSSMGHASTSLSQALGLRAARDLNSENHKIVVVMGDGALTGGLALEALNNTGQLQKDLILILNDNERSISLNVGAMAKQLGELRSSRGYRRTKNAVKTFLSRFPRFGKWMIRIIDRVKLGLKAFLLPSMLFESFGFFYIGPVDGHDFRSLSHALQRAKNFTSPVVVHVITEKGKGYLPSEKDPTFFHSAPAFEPETGTPRNEEKTTYTEIVRKTLADLGGKLPELVCITAAMADGTGLNSFAQLYPERFFDVGIAEEHALSFAAGLALGGKHPVVALYSTFLQRGFDQLLHDICLQRLPVLLLIDRAGVVPGDGPTHQGIYDLSFLRCMPNLSILAPADGEELGAMIEASLRQNGPVAIRYPKCPAASGISIPSGSGSPAWGHGQCLREGREAAFLALGSAVELSLEAADLLQQNGIKTAVYNLRFLAPLDWQLIQEAHDRYPLLVTVEENVTSGGFGSAILESLNLGHRDTERVITLGLRSLPGIGSRNHLLRMAGLMPDAIAERVQSELANLEVKRRQSEAVSTSALAKGLGEPLGPPRPGAGYLGAEVPHCAGDQLRAQDVVAK